MSEDQPANRPDNDHRQNTHIAERAYAIWIQQGCPDGQDEVHWRQAEAELSGVEAPGDMSDAKGTDSARHDLVDTPARTIGRRETTET